MLTHEYETIYILPPDLDEADANKIHDKITTSIESSGGELMVREDWGRKKLAYAIRNHNHGQYVYLNYLGKAEVPVSLERAANLEDNLVRFLTVRLAEDVDVEECRAIAQERHRKRAEKMAQETAAREAADREGRRRRDDDDRGRDDDDDDNDDDDGNDDNNGDSDSQD